MWRIDSYALLGIPADPSGEHPAESKSDGLSNYYDYLGHLLTEILSRSEPQRSELIKNAMDSLQGLTMIEGEDAN